ncbi:MAG: hypothetical protein GF398_04785 [Chitinivibrionales bacterium]|nr:hypothetical protein [Chitinivibrionales bacterium]
MKLRIVAGSLRGRYITITGKAARCRPTLARVREAVANIIRDDLPGATVADVCAGTGAMGIEFFSRGAGRVDFVENDKYLVRALYQTLESFGMQQHCRVPAADLHKFISANTSMYDIAWYDPPYDREEYLKILPQLLHILKQDGILLFERRRKSMKMDLPDTGIIPCDVREYGGTIVEMYRKS